MAAVTTAGFSTVASDRSLGRNMPQRLGSLLWLPMFLMALGFFAAGFIVGVIRANEIAEASPAADTIESLHHLGAGLMFIGFAAVFGAIAFAIARILGAFRAGGGEMQEASGRGVKTLAMPLTAKLFIAGMAMSMMALVGASILHFVFAADVSSTAASLEDSEQRFIVLEGIRRVGVALYLLSILLGLATIIQVLRFQSVRIRELATEPRRG